MDIESQGIRAHCLPSTDFTLMKPWASGKSTVPKGQVYTILQRTSLIKNSSKEASISVTLLYLITLWFRNVFFSLRLTLSKGRNVAMLSPLMWRTITKHFRTTYTARFCLLPSHTQKKHAILLKEYKKCFTMQSAFVWVEHNLLQLTA